MESTFTPRHREPVECGLHNETAPSGCKATTFPVLTNEKRLGQKKKHCNWRTTTFRISIWTEMAFLFVNHGLHTTVKSQTCSHEAPVCQSWLSCTTWEARMCHNWLHLFTRPHTHMHKAVKANLLRVCKCSKLKMVLTAVCGKKRGWKLRSVGVVRVESFPGKDSVQAHGAQPPLTEILKILKKYNNYVVIPSFFSKAPKI